MFKYLCKNWFAHTSASAGDKGHEEESVVENSHKVDYILAGGQNKNRKRTVGHCLDGDAKDTLDSGAILCKFEIFSIFEI